MEPYQQILENIKWPTDILTLDFETYFDTEYSLGKKLSTVEYVLDERFEFTGLGYQWLGSAFTPPYFYQGNAVKAGIAELQRTFRQNFERVTVIIQNAKFDALILKEKFGINPPYIIDTVDLAKFYDARMSHRLKDLTKTFGCSSPKGDTQQFKGLHHKDMTPEQKRALSEYCRTDIDLTTELLMLLLPLISNPTIEIPLARHTLGLYLNPQVKLNFGEAEKLKAEMESEKNIVLDKVAWVSMYITKKHKTVAKVLNSDRFKELLEDTLPEGEQAPMKQGKNKMILAVAQADEGMKFLLTHPEEEVRLLAEARLAISSWPLHIKRVQNLINQAKARDGWLGIPLSYYSAHTGRFGGTEGLNVQNFGKRGRTGSGIHPLIKKVGSLIEAPEDYTFITPDLSQIEARMLAWFAGQDDLLESFARGEDVYSEFATTLFNSKVYKPDKDDPEPIQKLMGIRRGFGKDNILGDGYGMGAARLYTNCLQNAGLRPLFKEPSTRDAKHLQKIMQQHTKTIIACGIKNYTPPKAGQYDEKFVAYLILKYRTTFTKIVDFWDFCEKAFRWVIKYPHENVTYPEKEVCKNGDAIKVLYYPGGQKLNFRNENGTVFIRLPSGRELRYSHARIIKDRYNGAIAWRWGRLYGALLVENIVQATSRDILAEAILMIEPFNPIVCHVHDSITTLVKKDSVRFALPKIEKAMRRNPEWAEGLPIDVESEVKGTF